MTDRREHPYTPLPLSEEQKRRKRLVEIRAEMSTLEKQLSETTDIETYRELQKQLRGAQSQIMELL